MHSCSLTSLTLRATGPDRPRQDDRPRLVMTAGLNWKRPRPGGPGHPQEAAAGSRLPSRWASPGVSLSLCPCERCFPTACWWRPHSQHPGLWQPCGLGSHPGSPLTPSLWQGSAIPSRFTGRRGSPYLDRARQDSGRVSGLERMPRPLCDTKCHHILIRYFLS